MTTGMQRLSMHVPCAQMGNDSGHNSTLKTKILSNTKIKIKKTKYIGTSKDGEVANRWEMNSYGFKLAKGIICGEGRTILKSPDCMQSD